MRAVYTQGFERSALYDPACGDERSLEARTETWVEMRLTSHPSAQVAKVLATFRRQGGGRLEVTFVGQFQAGALGYGHMSRSRFQMIVSRIEEAKLLPIEQDGCTRLDETERFHYLSYVVAEEGGLLPSAKAPAVVDSHLFTGRGGKKEMTGKKQQLVWLQLTNNSSCPITIPTASAYRSLTPQGAVSFELEDQAEVALLYKLSPRYIKQKERRMKSPFGTMSVLPVGRSIYFSVPLRYLTHEHYDVRVPIGYPNGKLREHYESLYFSAYDLPEGLRKQIKDP